MKNKNIRSGIIFIFSFLILSTSLNAQTFTFDIEETLTIGQAESDSAEYLFGAIRSVKSDHQGRIFVADASDNSIRVFDDSGHFIKKIGRRGRGPGEFMEVTSIDITDNNEIIVLDRFQNRVSVFDSNGELKQTETSELLSSGASALYRDNENNRFFLVARYYVNQEDEGYLLHHINNSWIRTEARYFNVFEYFFDPLNSLQVSISRAPTYQSAKLGNHTLALTPYIYTGTLILFNVETKSEQLIGEAIPDLVTEYDSNQRERYLNGDETGFATTSGPQGSFLYKKKGSTFGFIENSKFLLHFYGLFEGKEIIPYLNVYSSSGEKLASVSLENNETSFIHYSNTFSFKPLFLDEDNNIYVSDHFYQNSHPAVRVFKTNLDELIE